MISEVYVFMVNIMDDQIYENLICSSGWKRKKEV